MGIGAEGQSVRVGIPDEESWFRHSYLPGGAATGWRRAGCLTMVAFAVACFGLVVVLALTR